MHKPEVNYGMLICGMIVVGMFKKVLGMPVWYIIVHGLYAILKVFSKS